MSASRYKLGAYRVRPATNRDSYAVKALVFAVLAEYGLPADPTGTDADLDDIERTYAKDGGSFEVIEDPSGRLVGAAGLCSIDARTFELRKMYLARSVRGRGFGKWLLTRCLETARRCNAQRIRLETASVLTEANALSRSFGFQPTATPPHAARCDQTFELVIAAAPARPTALPSVTPRPRHRQRRAAQGHAKRRRTSSKKNKSSAGVKKEPRIGAKSQKRRRSTRKGHAGTIRKPRAK
jgi:putative acetyltransferase